LNVSPLIFKQAIYAPADKPVPRSKSNVFAKLISIADVMELLNELVYEGSMSAEPTVKVRSNKPFAPPSLGITKVIKGTER